MKNTEATSLSNEQWGSHTNRTSNNTALQKIMTFEYGRYMKATIATFANDQMACFDRMHPKITNFVAAANGCENKPLECREKTIASL